MTGTLKFYHNGFPNDVNMRPVSDTLSFHRRVFPEKNWLGNLLTCGRRDVG
jgi:hypothetical protein